MMGRGEGMGGDKIEFCIFNDPWVNDIKYFWGTPGLAVVFNVEEYLEVSQIWDKYF